MEINRVWQFPSAKTFSIKAVKALIEKYRAKVPNGVIIDPFANDSKLGTVTNDIDTNYKTDFHLEATDFLRLFEKSSVDLVLYDPPYSPRQLSECYRRLGKSVTMKDTQASYWSEQKKLIGEIVKPNGFVISFGRNSGGVGKKNGFEIIEILLVAHGGSHNDTICTVERKVGITV